MSELLHRRVTHRHNPELGTGRIVEIDDRFVTVEFPASDTVLRLGVTSAALQPVVWAPGSRVRFEESGEIAVVEAVEGDDRVRLDDGRVVEPERLWPVDAGRTLFDRLAEGDVDRLDDVALRLDTLHLEAARGADGLGTFLGGRIRLFPHQLYVAERATTETPVRWLLADEVGLGKTVEACLVLNRLTRTGDAGRTIVVAPSTLTVQWLGELWRKYHQVFVLLDDARLSDVEKEYGAGFNPFDVYGRVIVAMDMLVENPKLVAYATEAEFDLLIVDEAHHLRRAPGHPGNPEYRAVRPLAETISNVLLLTATPLEDDAHGFFRLLQLLRPDEFPEESTFEDRLTRREPLPPCTSATRREDIGGLPPRVGVPVEVDDPAGWDAIEALEASLLAAPADGPVAARRKVERLQRALSSGAALEPTLGRDDREWKRLARSASEVDPRVRWLAESARRWRERGDRTLVFVAHRETLEMVREALSRRSQVRSGVFHEDLSAARRDIEVAQFRTRSGPSILISTECGGEGRNFEFCTRLVLFDLPWDPVVVEQRVGRLDRIGRRHPVEIVYFRPPGGFGRSLSDLYESLGLFREPLGGIERELAQIEPALDDAAARGENGIEPERLATILDEAGEARDRIRDAAYHELHRDPYRADMGPAILQRVPPGLEDLTEEIVLPALERLGLHVEPQRGSATYSVEFSSRAVVDSLPGVPGGSHFLGTFDREEAVENEDVDFFASGHALVEGVLAHLDDSELGRVGLVHLSSDTESGFGIVAIHRTPAGLAGEAIDLDGHPRPDWAGRVLERPLRSRRVDAGSWTGQPGWPRLIRTLADRLEFPGRPEAVVAVRIGV